MKVIATISFLTILLFGTTLSLWAQNEPSTSANTPTVTENSTPADCTTSPTTENDQPEAFEPAKIVLTRAERAEIFRQKLLADKKSVDKLHKYGIQVAYLAGLEWQVYPNECKEIILISSSHQRVIKFVDGLPKFVYICSTRSPHHGKERFGFYEVISKEKCHWSKKYLVKMPWALMFDELGVFIHQTKMVKQLGKRESHGCIRLNGANAYELYIDTSIGTPVAYLL